MKRLFVAFILSVLCVTAALAEDITVKATVSDNRVAMGSGVTYTITVTGVQGVNPPQIAGVDGFDIRYTGPSTQVSVINGAYSVQQSFNYALIPLKEGKFTLPPLTIDVKGQPFTTQPILVEVISAQVAAQGKDSNTVQQDIENRLRLLVSMPKDHVYFGEALPVMIRLYVNQLSLQEVAFPEITQDGFQIDPFTDARQLNEVMDGVNWHVIEFATNLYPTHAGELVIAPILVRGSIVFKMENQRDPGGVFDEGFFSNFFTSYQKRPVTITSRSIKFQVMPLPEDGRPADFSGAVGQYDLLMEAAPLKVKAGDPITVRAAITGAGNLKDVKFPEFKAEGFKVYDPQIKDEPGRKSMEQVIVPTDVKQTSIPSMKFSYFDAKANMYKTIERGPLAIEVAPTASGEEFQAVGFSQGAVVPETIGRDILFVKENPGKFDKKQTFVRRNLAFYIALVIYLQVWAGLLVFYFYRRRLLLDPAFARQQVAARHALTALALAKEPLEKGDTKAFYDVLVKALNEYFIHRVGLVPGKTDMATLEGALRQMKVDEQNITMVEDIYATAEQARFAGMSMPEGQMRNHLSDAEDIIRVVERRAR